MLKKIVVGVTLTALAPFAAAQSSHHYEAEDPNAPAKREAEAPTASPAAPARGRTVPRVFRVVRPGVIHAEANEVQAPGAPGQGDGAPVGAALGGSGLSDGGPGRPAGGQAAANGGSGSSTGGSGGGAMGGSSPIRSKPPQGGSGAAPASPGKDPGKGLWMPKGRTDLFVVDPGNSVHSTVEQLPGTIDLNGLKTFTQIEAQRPGWKTKDFYAYPPTGAVVSFKPGNTVSLRFRTGTTPVKRNGSLYAPGSVGGYFSFNNFDGGNFPWSATLSASVVPGDFSDPRCALSFKGNPNPRVFVESIPPLVDLKGAGLCIIPPGTDYYLNIRIDNRNGAAVTSRIKGDDGRYVWTPFTDAEIEAADCRSPVVFCPIMKLVPTGDILGYFGGADPFAGAAPEPVAGGGAGGAPADASTCALPGGATLAAGDGYARLWYRNSGCVQANFVCRHGSLAYAPSQFSPAPTPPAPGAAFFADREACD